MDHSKRVESILQVLKVVLERGYVDKEVLAVTGPKVELHQAKVLIVSIID